MRYWWIATLVLITPIINVLTGNRYNVIIIARRKTIRHICRCRFNMTWSRKLNIRQHVKLGWSRYKLNSWNLNMTAWIIFTSRDSWENCRWNPWKRVTNRTLTSMHKWYKNIFIAKLRSLQFILRECMSTIW